MRETAEKHLRIFERGQRETGKYDDSATLGNEIKVDAQILDGLSQGTYQTIHFDLMVVCAAIEYADRRWGRNEAWSRKLKLTIPVCAWDVWQDVEISEYLSHLLRYLTCDSWKFEFVQAKDYPKAKGQKRIVFSDQKTFAIAYSEGLDSRAVWALSGTANESICIRVAKSYNRAKDGDSLFAQIPFSVTVPNGGAESSFRTRAFQFASLTAIVAQIANFSRIVVPESGQGILSPAMLPLHRVYADYRNYPLFFRKMERFISVLLRHTVSYEQERLWSTKGQTMCDFLKLPEKSPEYLISTRSCWQSRHVVNQGWQRQCGLCAACILRRFSLQRAGIVEPEGTYVVRDLTASEAKDALRMVPDKQMENMLAYGIAGVRHFQQFAELSRQPDEALKLHTINLAAAVGLPEDECRANLRSLLSAHASEWTEFISAQGKNSFLWNWIDGGN
jgi:7-cyano-7-deazaguanine synthase in queuosine biosynthesis